MLNFDWYYFPSSEPEHVNDPRFSLIRFPSSHPIRFPHLHLTSFVTLVE